MPHPTWLAYGFAGLMVAISLYCIGRLLLAKRLNRRNHYDVNVSHVLMGAAMAGMLVPSWNYVPNGLWEVIFALIALWFTGLSIQFVVQHGLKGTDDAHAHHISHYLIHMVMACAMLYMYWVGAPTAGSNMSMASRATSAGDPGLTLLLVAILFGSAVWQLDAISRFAPRQLSLVGASSGAATAGAGPYIADDDGASDDGVADYAPQRWLAPRLEIGCHICMCITMGYMLILML